MENNAIMHQIKIKSRSEEKIILHLGTYNIYIAINM